MINENELWKINDLRMRLLEHLLIQNFVPGEHVNIDCSFAGNCWNGLVCSSMYALQAKQCSACQMIVAFILSFPRLWSVDYGLYEIMVEQIMN